MPHHCHRIGEIPHDGLEGLSEFKVRDFNGDFELYCFQDLCFHLDQTFDLDVSCRNGVKEPFERHFVDFIEFPGDPEAGGHSGFNQGQVLVNWSSVLLYFLRVFIEDSYAQKKSLPGQKVDLLFNVEETLKMGVSMVFLQL